MYSWTHVCWMCVRLFYVFIFGIFVWKKMVDISCHDGILIFII